MTKVKVDEDLLRGYFLEAWKKVFDDPTLVARYRNAPVLDVLKDETKNVVEAVLKRFRP